MPQDRFRRRRPSSRSLSPPPTKHKRSWQTTASSSSDRSHSRKYSVSPPRGHGKKFKSPPKFGGKKPFFGGRRSRSPRNQKRQRLKSPASDEGFSTYQPPQPRFSPPPERNRPSQSRAVRGRSNERSGSRRQWSHSPPLLPKSGHDRDKQFDRSPEVRRDRHHSKTKKDRGFSSPPIKRPRSISLRRRHSPEPHLSSTKTGPSDKGEMQRGHSGSSKNRGGSIPQQRVRSSEGKKPPRLTLHQRFTLDDQEGFYLEENVTIAILRNPNVEPSEETTVKRVFDPVIFKMVHKKTEGRKPIFDREEIKAWRHDDNLADDPDFECRLVRVKSSTSTSGKQAAVARGMSPDMIRKAFGHANSPSLLRGPRVKLDPKPDPRYESKYRQQVEKEESVGWRSDRGRNNVEDDHKNSKKRREEESYKSREDERRVERGQGDTYDLRQALDRRRSDRDDGGGFKIEVSRGKRESSTELYYRDVDSKRDSSPDKGRSVVMGYDRRDKEGEDTSYKWQDRRGRGRGRGRGWRGRFNNRDWSPDRTVQDRREDTYSSRERRSTERRYNRYSESPPRGGRSSGFRPRGRGRDRDYVVYDQEVISSPVDLDALADKYKYLQHDDRDVSPMLFRGRGRGRFQSRGFGSSGFRANTRGFRGRGRFGGSIGYRGRGFTSRSPTDRRSVERGRDLSVEREWKHDMYDSLQAEEEQPHSTTVGT